MADEFVPNGERPMSPQSRRVSLSLTEYTANPTPPGTRYDCPRDWDIPEAFLLPNGYPDVRMPVVNGLGLLLTFM